MSTKIKKLQSSKIAIIVSLGLLAWPVSFSFADSIVVDETAERLSPIEIEMKKRADKMPVWHATLMPGEVYRPDMTGAVYAEVDGELIGEEWKASMEAGNHKLEIFDFAGNVVKTLTLFVLEPSTAIDKRGYIGKYRIGFYPKDTPKGFIKLEKTKAPYRFLRISRSDNFFVSKSQVLGQNMY